MDPVCRQRPTNPGGFTLESAERLMPSDVRYELHQGRVVMRNLNPLWHTRLQHRLVDLLQCQGRIAYPRVGLSFAPNEMRILDAAAFQNQPDENRAHFQPEELTLAVEVVPTSSEGGDYTSKSRLYALLGVPEFWRVNRAEDGSLVVEMSILNRQDELYQLTGTATVVDLEAAATA